LAINGQAMAEFLLVAPLFFFLIFAVFDYAHLFLVQMEVENAVQEAGRYASRGIIFRIQRTPDSI
jgi:Flp pilus assembly protein TadG